VLVWLLDWRGLLPKSQEMRGGGLLCLVRQVIVSSLFSVTVSVAYACKEVLADCIEIEEGGTKNNTMFKLFDKNVLACTVRRAEVDVRAS
jgi:hypothetical protein